MTNDLLFVYGSFSEGMVHFAKISNYILETFPAQVRGTIYQLEVGYPVLVDGGNDIVFGSVVKLKDADLLYKILDEFHGYSLTEPNKSLYLRSSFVANKVPSMEEIRVLGYTLNPVKLPRGATKISDGNWLRAMSEQPSILNTLTERHKGYIKKLAESDRRETIVYPLDVCRDLERMQIIVDKGRRFALTNLGKEVSRFI
ncbi:MAG: hypothetical protein A4S09_02020 [Proteobacteria bacterium SG_bin7]|nr:MAG: hypothetical protein A4S09_02020 [Proteobacteria bacterium SG_bin7]